MIIQINPPIPEFISKWEHIDWLSSLGLTAGTLTFSGVNNTAFLEIEEDISQEKFDLLLSEYEAKTKKLQVVSKEVAANGKIIYTEVKTLPTDTELLSKTEVINEVK